MEFDYKKQSVHIIEDSLPAYPPNFNSKIQILTGLWSTIDFNVNSVYHNFTHYCSLDTYCAKRFLMNTLEQYRIQSYELFIESLRELLQLNNLPSTPLRPIRCLDKKDKSINCNNGKCYAHESPFTTNTKRECGHRNFNFPSPFFITIPNLNVWILFFFSFECYWPLCNNKSLVADIENLITTNIYSSLTTTMTSQSIYTNKPIKFRPIKHMDIDNSAHLILTNQQWIILISIFMIIHRLFYICLFFNK